jgi:hypothetical protein
MPDVVSAYLAGSPFDRLLNQPVPFVIPDEMRYRGAYVVAPTGRGKTTLLKALIAQDLLKVAKGEASVVVINSDRDLIDDIAKLKAFAPGQALHGKLVVLEPDMEFPLALNLFAMGKNRFETYDANRREQLINGAVELYRYLFDGLSETGLTDKQLALFRPTIRALIQLRGASILTLKDLLISDPRRRPALDLSSLDDDSRSFMTTMFWESTFASTRAELGWRLHGILDARAFSMMFAAPECKLDLFSEMNAGKVVLIHTNKVLLDDPQTEMFGRFFIAMILRAAQERAAIGRNDRMPTYLFVDECHDYIRRDTKITTILSQCRKMRVATTLANQKLSDLTAPVQAALLDVAIKFANVGEEAEIFYKRLHAPDPAFLNKPRGQFAAYIDELTPRAVTLRVPEGLIDDRPKMTPKEEHATLTHMRTVYSYSQSFQRAPVVSPALALPAPGPIDGDTDPKPWGKE